MHIVNSTLKKKIIKNKTSVAFSIRNSWKQKKNRLSRSHIFHSESQKTDFTPTQIPHIEISRPVLTQHFSAEMNSWKLLLINYGK